nr:zinc finger, CCHC-type [Tanacetum cinerariifolium]
MHFLLFSISVVYVLTTPMLEDGGENPTMEQVRRRDKWDNDDYVCRGKKFLVSNFANYKMIDSRPVLEQYNKLLGILRRFTQHKMKMDKSIQVSCIIDKFFPSWKDFKHTLKHLKEKLTLIELGSHLRIKESLRVQDSDKPKGNNVAGPSVVNMVEHNNSFRYNDNKGTDENICSSKRASLDSMIELIATESLVPRPSQRPLKDGTEDFGGSVVSERVTKKVVQQPKDEISDQHSYCFNVEGDHKTFDEVMKSQDVAFWKEAINDEIKRFSMKDMGKIDVILAIRIKHESNGIAISQSHYIEKVLKKFNYFDCTPASKKQTCITGSTMESEFVALAAAGKEAECADTLAKAYSQMYNRKSRHLGIRHIMIRELITNGVVSIEFVRSQQNLADHFAKGLARDLVIKSAEWMRLKSEAHVLQIIPWMCLQPAKKEDAVVNFLMVNVFEKVLCKSMNKEKPPMVQFIPGNEASRYGVYTQRSLNTLTQIVVKREFMSLMKFRGR